MSGPRADHWIVAAVAAVLVVFTWVVETRVPRYAATGPELLANGALGEGLGGWEVRTQGSGSVTHEEGAAVLRAEPCDAEKCAGIVLQSVGPPMSGLLVGSVEVEVEGAAPGTQAFVSLLSRGADGRFAWSRPNKVVPVTDGSPWTRFEGAIHAAPDAADVVLLAMIQGKSGTMRLRDASVRTGSVRPTYAALHRAGQLGWIGLAAVWTGLLVFRQPRLRWRLPFLGTLAVVLWMLLITPGQASEAVNGAVAFVASSDEPVDPVPDAAPEPPKHTWIRAALRVAWDGTTQETFHLAMFALLAFFARRAFEGPRWRLFAQLLALAAITELLQQYSDRDTSLEDVGWDAIGLVIGLLAAPSPSRRR